MYKLISKEYSIEGITYIGYGIEAADGQGRVEDLSTEKGEVEKLIALCNDLCLSCLHLEDIAADFLGNT